MEIHAFVDEGAKPVSLVGFGRMGSPEVDKLASQSDVSEVAGLMNTVRSGLAQGFSIPKCVPKYTLLIGAAPRNVRGLEP